MKKYCILLAAAILTGTTACSDNENDTPVTSEDHTEAAFKGIVADYVDNTVVPTYRGLADASMKLADVCDRMCTGGIDKLTPELISEAGQHWIEARRYWELSEAWLYGAAADYDIDPHIDTWPLDKAAMDAMLGNPGQMAQMSDRESAGVYVGSSLGQGLLGFHAIEYMIFEPTNATTATTSPRPVARFTQNELFYLAAVADDLRNCCIRLEASWADAGSVSSDKLAILDDAEISYGKNYGAYLKEASSAGSIYVNYASVLQDILVGAQDIADEVGNQKIGRPCGSGIEADPDYIESPYALNSITDFVDNIRSVRHAYMGYQPLAGENESYLRPSSHTISAYISTLNADLDSRIRAAIDRAQNSIAKMREPFASTSADASMRTINFEAIDACNDLVDIFDEAIELISK